MNERPNIAIIVNPVAGSGRRGRLIERLRGRLEEGGHPCELVYPTGPDDLPKCVERHAVDGTIIALAGGDGTIRDALPGLMGRPNPLLLVPLGTENLLARHLGLRRDADALWDVLRHGRVAAMDLALLNGRPFATVLGVGFDAEVVERLARGRNGHITYLDYIGPFFETFFKYRFPAVRVVADGEEVCNEPALVFVGNISRYAIGLRILRRARWDDGLLDVCVIRCKHHARLLGHAWRALLNRHVEHPLVSYHQVRRVELESEQRLALQSDGDPAGELPARVEIAPGAINMYVPPPVG
ncbi:MAG: diacylglycerol kinase family lipid kinase [Planctomycetes bacterium]|nr:diacylglycerol kinase family lipid kinase [Planctomycetota bacterium]